MSSASKTTSTKSSRRRNRRKRTSMANTDWYRDRSFDRFWSLYGACQKWTQKHQTAREQSVAHVPLMPPPAPPKVTIKEEFVVKRQRTLSKDIEKNTQQEEETTNIELSEEMLAFFRQTVLHKQQRDKEKNQEESSSTPWFTKQEEYVSADKIGVHSKSEATVLPPTKDRANERRREANEMYGAKADKIETLEVKMQMSFDEQYMRYKPPLWPNIPLKL